MASHTLITLKSPPSTVIPEHGIDSSQLQGSSFSCNICDDKFTNKLKISMHYVLNHQLRNCSMCTAVFASENDKRSHENTVHYPLKCTECQTEFYDHSLLKDHYTEKHETKLCDFCPTLIQPIAQYQTHIARRHAIQNMDAIENGTEIFKIDTIKSTYSCFMCSKGKKLTEIFGHYLFYHNLSLNVILEYVTKYSDILKVEGATSQPINDVSDEIIPKNIVKTEIDLDACGICNKEFSDEAPKLLHDVYCKGFVLCKECGHVFMDSNKLKEHTNVQHNEVSCKFGCGDVKLKLTELSSHVQLIHDITDCILCGLFISSCSNKLNSHLKEKHNVDLQIYEKCNDKSKLYRLEGTKSKKVFCNFCNNDITKTMEDVCNVISHYEIVHDISKNFMLKKLDKNPILDIIIKKRKIDEKKAKNENDYLSNFTLVSNVDGLDSNDNTKYTYDFDSNLVHCIASDTSDDEFLDEYNAEPIINIKTEINAATSNESSSEVDDDTEERTKAIDSVQLTNPSLSKSVNKNKHTGKCQFCGIKTVTMRSLYAHMQSNHGFELKYTEPKCKLCKVEFSSVNCLTRHNKRKHLPKTLTSKVPIYECPFCPNKNENKGSIRKHLKEHPEIEKNNCNKESLGYMCRYCSNLYWTPEQRNTHQISDHQAEITKDMMICFICGAIFSSKCVLRKHSIQEHTDQPKVGRIIYRCSICKVVYPCLENLRPHMQKVHPYDTSLYCATQACKMKIGDSDLESHYTEYHQSKTTKVELKFKCNLCGKICKSEQSAKTHYQTIHENKKAKIRGFKCRLCEKEFRTHDDRKLHCITEHIGEKIYQCTHCDKGFSNKSGLYTHLQVHSTVNKKVCPHCNKEFNRNDSYSEHLLIHQGPQHKCTYCPKTFVQRSNLIRHERIHTGEKPYKCNYCEKTFSDRGACSSHERVHTREEVSQCPHCEKSFSKKQKLRYHIRTHTGENLQTCDICSKTFTNSHSLKMHKMTHEKDANEQCTLCEKSFRNNLYLKRHVLSVHMKNHQYECHICNKSFSTRYKMREHLMTHGCGKHIQCLMCGFRCSSEKYCRKHLIRFHGLNKDEKPLRNFIHVRTPEEEGILPSTSTSNEDPLNINMNTNDIEDEIEDSSDDEIDDIDHLMLEPEIVMAGKENSS